MNALTVRVSGIEVGTLEVFDDCSHRFTFAQSYVSSLLSNRPILGQLFEDRMPGSIDVAGPMCWFSHLLPQGAMRRWRSQLLNIEDDDDFELLSYLGGDMPGAVTLHPGHSPVNRPGKEPTARQSDHPNALFKFSLAGAQWKLSARSAGRGLTTAATTEDDIAYIAKFDAPEFPGLPQCEFATMNWAQESGIAVPTFALRKVADFDQLPEQMPVGAGSVFVIQRFDRSVDGRTHIEDFGQILDRPPGQRQYQGSYEDIGLVIRWICPEDAIQFLKLVVFTVICGNGDGHLKNFSVTYPDRRKARLSPAYDIVSTVCYYENGKENLALKLGGVADFTAINQSHFEPLIEALGIHRQTGANIVKDTVSRTLDAWNTRWVRDEFSARHQQRIEKHVESLHCK